MKKTYSILTLFLGIGLGGILFAQQSEELETVVIHKGENQPDERVHVRKDIDENNKDIDEISNGERMDSTWLWSWSWDKDMPVNLQERLQEFIDRFGDGVTFHFNDSTFSGRRFHEFFNEGFSRKRESLQDLHENFDKDILEKLNEKLGKLQDEDIHFQWDENFKHHMEQGIEQMLQKWQEYYQEHQQDHFHPGRKAL